MANTAVTYGHQFAPAPAIQMLNKYLHCPVTYNFEKNSSVVLVFSPLRIATRSAFGMEVHQQTQDNWKKENIIWKKSRMPYIIITPICNPGHLFIILNSHNMKHTACEALWARSCYK